MARDVVLNLKPLRKLERDLRAIDRAQGGGELGQVMNQWASRYLGFARRRYVRNSRGGGSWPPLSKRTIEKRRSGGKKRGGSSRLQVNSTRTGGRVAILRDTGTLLNTLDVGRRDNRRRINGGVEVGFLPDKRHSSGGPTISELARMHQTGAGRLPARKLVVEPDQQTIQQMERDAMAGLMRHLKRNAIR